MAIYIVGSFLSGSYPPAKTCWTIWRALHFPTWGYIAAIIQSVLLAFSTLENYYSVYKTMSGKAAV